MRVASEETDAALKDLGDGCVERRVFVRRRGRIRPTVQSGWLFGRVQKVSTKKVEPARVRGFYPLYDFAIHVVGMWCLWPRVRGAARKSLQNSAETLVLNLLSTVFGSLGLRINGI